MRWDFYLKRVYGSTLCTKKWSIKEQARFFLQVGELLAEGFSLVDIVQLLPLFFVKHVASLERMSQQLAAGFAFEACLLEMGVSETLVSRVYLSMQQGTLEKTCQEIGRYLSIQEAQWRKLRQVLIYPCLLIVVLALMVLTLRYLLLEELMGMVNVELLSKDKLLYFIWLGFVHLPKVIGGIIGVFGVLISLIALLWHRKSALEKGKCLVRLPLVGKMFRQYYTYVYALEFSYLLSEGQSLLQMLSLMQQGGTSKLSMEIAKEIERVLLEGKGFAVALSEIKIFEKELIWLVVEGEYTTHLDKKLRQYAQYTFDCYCVSVERKIVLLQPILFIGIGLMIIVMYLILLLPSLTMIGGI